MKLGYFVTAGILLTPIPFMGMTQPAAAANTHRVTLGGTLFVNSYREGYSFKLGEVVHLTHDRRSDTFRIERCSFDGEARGVLTVTVSLSSSEKVIARPSLSLYEENTCYNNDREGTAIAKAAAISFNHVRKWDLVVNNGEFLSMDFAHAKITVSNTVGPDRGRPREPSNLIAQQASASTCAVKICKRKTVSLSWEDNAKNETGYEVRNNNLEKIVRLGPNRTGYLWTDLDPNTRQCFQVRAVGPGAIGPSDWTPESTASECV
ncbi:fibronectin type III domain-containing protein [Streptomyces sp. NPDC057690]|uniref:fibronectin type III domain-containing protein n=1 Tax=Streptomyces sp. NPDC057690 TaxID=3346214 RepID=UPI0036AE6685